MLRSFSSWIGIHSTKVPSRRLRFGFLDELFHGERPNQFCHELPPHVSPWWRSSQKSSTCFVSFQMRRRSHLTHLEDHKSLVILPNTYISLYIIIYHYNGWLMSQVWRCFTDHRSPDLTHSWGPSRSLRSECSHQWRSLGQGFEASPGGSGTRGTPRGWGFLRFSTVCGCSSHHYGMVLYRPCPCQCDILGCCFILWL